MLVGGESMRSERDGRCEPSAAVETDGRIAVSSSKDGMRERPEGRDDGRIEPEAGVESDGGGATRAPRDGGGALREGGGLVRGGGGSVGAFVGMNIVISSSETDLAKARGRSDR